MIVSELLCYIPNKIDTNDHEYLIKIVCENYSEREIIQGSNDLGLHVLEPSGNKRRLQIEITFILTVCCSSQRVSASGQFAADELILNSTTKPLRPRRDRTLLLVLSIGGDIHPNLVHTAKYPCPVCARDIITSRGVSYRCTRWVHAICSGLLNAAQYRRNKDWTCDPCSASKTHQSTLPLLPPTPTLLHLPNKLVIAARSTFYSSTLIESETNWQN